MYYTLGANWFFYAAEVGNSLCNSVAHGIKVRLTILTFCIWLKQLHVALLSLSLSLRYFYFNNHVMQVGRSSDTEDWTPELPIDSPLSSHREKEDIIGCESLNQSLPVDMPNVGSDSNESSAVERADSSCASSHTIESLCPNYVDSSVEKMLDNQVGSSGGDGDTSIENPGTAKKWEIISSLISRVNSASPLQERIDEEGECITSAIAEETSDVKNTLTNSSDCAFDSDPTDQGTDGMESIPYNPYIWKPEEIMVASGKVEVLSVEHSLKLKSTYAQVEVTPSWLGRLYALHSSL